MMKNNENKIESRRNFLKKAAYAVPTVIAISQITNPLVAGASTIKGTTPSTTNPNVLTVQVKQIQIVQIINNLVIFLRKNKNNKCCCTTMKYLLIS